MEQPDYLLVGHISRDLTANGPVAGGTASYSGRTAHALGCRTAVVTSAASDYEWQEALPGISVHHVPAQATTTFANVYTQQGRQQTIYSVAARLTAADVPRAWQRAAIVHLAPIAGEVDPEMIHLFSNSQVGLTPQGWLRCWDEDGRVAACAWPEAEVILPLAAAVIFSEEDLPDKVLLNQYRQWSPLLVLTQGAAGCTVFCNGESQHVPAPAVTEVEATGAGDIFAAAFLARLRQTAGNPWEAARFANVIAAQSVTQAGLEAKIRQIELFLMRDE